MRKLIEKIKDFVSKKNIIVILLSFAIISFCFFATSTFMLGNSSFVVCEKTATNVFDSNGSDIRLRMYLSDETEGRRKSIINPVNTFNGYRINEFGRCASYVLEDIFSVTFDTGISVCNQILYADYYSEFFTTNRINLISTRFSKETFSDIHSIYLSRPIIDKIPGLDVNNVIGQKIKLSLDDEAEFIVRGVIENKGVKGTGLYFSKLFSDCFVVMNSLNVYKYDFTDLLFQSPDYYFVDDFADIYSSFSSTYLDINSINLKTISFYDNTPEISDVFKVPNIKTPISILMSFLSIFVLSILFIALVIIFIFYSFSNLSNLVKILSCVFCLVLAFVPMIAGLLMMIMGCFLSRFSISLLIAFAAISLFMILFKFSLLTHIGKDELEEAQNGK